MRNGTEQYSQNNRSSNCEFDDMRPFSFEFARKCFSSGAACQYFGSFPWMPRAKAVAMTPLKNASSP